MTRSHLAHVALAALVLAGAALAGEPQEVRDDLAGSQEAPLTGVWLGTFRQYDPGRFWSYRMRMEVDEDVDGRVSGTLHWPTLHDSVSRFEGVREGAALRFTEPEILQGRNLLLHGEYRASFRTPDRLEGIWSYPQDRERPGFGTFVLERTALPRKWGAPPGWLGR